MTDALRPFGTLADGRTVHAVRLARPGGAAVEILDYGAVVRSLQVPGRAGPVETVLGFDNLAAYERDPAYQGCVVGRFANRIAAARFEIDGRAYAVAANEGRNCLHGGVLGLSRRIWRFGPVEADGCAVTLAYRSPDGEEGFPGALEARVRFALVAPQTLVIEWRAQTDRPTPVNLTQHLYFNLSGDPALGVLDHSLAVAADAVTPVRPDLIPTGELMAVDDTAFDLRRPRRLGEALEADHPQLTLAGGYDHNWVLRRRAAPAVALSSPRTGLRLEVETDQPGVQIYSGQGLAAPFGPHAGLALEPQNFPDAVNQPGFPDAILRPDQVYRRRAAYRFSLGEPG